jgi:hypothetical protein
MYKHASFSRRMAWVATWAASAAQAHEGHGLSGAHWHATDSVGFVAVAVAAAIWLIRRK